VSGDYSRESFDPRRHFSAVRMQQGRVALDADWNEQGAIVERRTRAQTVDLVGRRGVPRETADGFAISIAIVANQRILRIGRGRLYVDGLLAENHGAAPFAFDRLLPRADGRGTAGVLAETIGTGAVDYREQPHWPVPTPLPGTDGPHLVYLDVWEREVTHIEDGSLLEKALNGVDTTTRLQTVWQVRVLPNVGTITCATPESSIPGWVTQTRPSAGRLTTALDPASSLNDPCLIATSGGYRGLENQLYRIEIADGGPPGTARFKWSRDNATVATTVVEIISPTIVGVASTGRDAILGFAPGQWVEVSDDRREFDQHPGAMLKILAVDYENRRITFTSPVPATLLPSGTGNDTLKGRRTRLRRWDHAGIVRDANGAMIVDLDAGGSVGTIPVPASATTVVVLEAGIRVSFSADPADGVFRAGDSWTFAARSIDGSVEILDKAPAQSIHHHYAPLALIRFPDEVVDQRTPFVPAIGSVQVCGALCVDANGRPRPLRPGLELPINLLDEGFAVLVRQTVDPETVNDGSIVVTAEIPYYVQPPYAGAAAGALVAYQPVVLPADVGLIGDGMIGWRPFTQTMTFLTDILQQDVPRIGNVRLDKEFDVFDHGGPASKWGIGAGNAIVQTQTLAGTRPDVTAKPLPTMAVHRHVLKANAAYAGLTVNDSFSGAVGLVYNWTAPGDFSLFIGRLVHVPIGFSGAMPTLVMSHVQIKGGSPVVATQKDITVSSGLSEPRRITFDIKQTGNRLQFGYSALLAGGSPSHPNLDFPVVTQFIPGSRLGVLTANTGSARFTRLQVVYGTEAPVTLIPAGFASRLLSRLIVKRSLLGVSTGADAAPPGGAFAPPMPQPDFETWCWLLPPVAGYGSAAATAAAATGGGYQGIGATRLLDAGLRP
jgi:hypothetical protein